VCARRFDRLLLPPTGRATDRCQSEHSHTMSIDQWNEAIALLDATCVSIGRAADTAFLAVSKPSVFSLRSSTADEAAAVRL
jgi:hypothetical protein